MNGTAFLGMTGGPSEQLKRPCNWQYPKPQSPEKDSVAVELYSWWFSRPYTKAATVDHTLAAGRAEGCQGGCSGWKSWFHTRPKSCRHWSLLRFLSEGFLYFRGKIPKQQKYFEKAVLSSCICLKKRTYSKQPVLVPSAHTDWQQEKKKTEEKTPVYKPILP